MAFPSVLDEHALDGTMLTEEGEQKSDQENTGQANKSWSPAMNRQLDDLRLQMEFSARSANVCGRINLR